MDSGFGQGGFGESGGGGYMPDNPGFGSPMTESQEKKVRSNGHSRLIIFSSSHFLFRHVILFN